MGWGSSTVSWGSSTVGWGSSTVSMSWGSSKNCRSWVILSRTVAPGLFSFSLVESGSPQILILPIAESSVVHRILSKLFQRFSIDFLWKIWVPPFSAHDWTACSMEINPLESGPTLRSNRTGGRLDLFHHAPSKAHCSLTRVTVPASLRGRSELAGGTTFEGDALLQFGDARLWLRHIRFTLEVFGTTTTTMCRRRSRGTTMYRIHLVRSTSPDNYTSPGTTEL